MVAGHAGRPAGAGLVQARRGQRGGGVPATRFFGVESEADRAAWPGLSLAGKCAMRWRGSVRQMARLRGRLPAGAADHVPLRGRDPAARGAAAAVSDFIDTAGAHRRAVRGRAVRRWPNPAAWRRALVPAQARGDRAGRGRGAAPGRLRKLSGYRGQALAVPAGQHRLPGRRTGCGRARRTGRPRRAARRACRARRPGPPSMTRIWSASRMVDSRCAMTSEVRPASAVFSARCTATSDSRVQVRGGLVEHDHRRRLEQQPGDRHPLLLAAGQPVAAVADDGVQARRAAPRSGPRSARPGSAAISSSSVASGRA